MKFIIKLENGTRIAGILSLVASFGIIKYLGLEMGIFLCYCCGLVAGLVIAYFTGLYTDTGKKQLTEFLIFAKTGPATTIIEGLAVGMESTVAPIIIIALAIIVAYMASKDVSGIYGISVATVGMLASTGMVVAVDAWTSGWQCWRNCWNGRTSMKLENVQISLMQLVTQQRQLEKDLQLDQLLALSLFAAYKEAVQTSTQDLISL